jgi:hypothetical protein
MASYRYRAHIPAHSLQAQINCYPADVLIFAKPIECEVDFAKWAQRKGAKIIVDYCDDHFELPHYQEFMGIADKITCSSKELAKLCNGMVIDDPYEFDELPPHFTNQQRLLWFGHKVNKASIDRLGIDCRKVSNFDGAIPWSIEILKDELSRADIVLMPATKGYKSPNRTVEAIRSGCFVVAEPHPSLLGFPIYQGDIKEGIAWATKHPKIVNQMIREAQSYISQKYSPATQASAWKKILVSI